MKDSFVSYVAAGLGGAALAAIVVNPGALLTLLQLAALLSGPVLILVMFRTVKGSRLEERANAKQEKRLRALHARLLRTVDEQRALGRAIDVFEARSSLSRSSVIIEAERIAREAAKRHRPSSPHA